MPLRQDRATDIAILPKVDPGIRQLVGRFLVQDIGFGRVVERDVSHTVTFLVIDSQASILQGFLWLGDSINEQSTAFETELTIINVPIVDANATLIDFRYNPAVRVEQLNHFVSQAASHWLGFLHHQPFSASCEHHHTR
jgi:hypothetical protein